MKTKVLLMVQVETDDGEVVMNHTKPLIYSRTPDKIEREIGEHIQVSGWFWQDMLKDWRGKKSSEIG